MVKRIETMNRGGENIEGRGRRRDVGSRVNRIFQKIVGEEEKQLVLGVGEVEMSKGATYEGRRNTECEDAHFCSAKEGIFAVFDGVGGEIGGRRASQIACEKIRAFSEQGELDGETSLSGVLGEISDDIASDVDAGATTATLVKITRERGKKYLDFAQVGDSRLYLVRGRDAVQITRDEGEGRRIINWLGKGAPGVTQTGRVPLLSGDKVVLCTDGVTGDYGDERMSNYEIAEIVNRANGSEQLAARLLVSEARKHDDRTAVVVSV